MKTLFAWALFPISLVVISDAVANESNEKGKKNKVSINLERPDTVVKPCTIVIQGDLKIINSTTGKCSGPKNACGFYPSSTSSRFYFPDDFAGPYPSNARQDENGDWFVDGATTQDGIENGEPVTYIYF